ncbi:hypothetical protein COV58_04300 [Candidatus Roizmanbacteria bacterium CG11_big_fil_rev_8_21_14_0_20_36_8]|uniref:Uncharacterized protein n=2 Tax=Candidatus Roizmaniibacteriota TaxID=1752723 RepID=A0A2M6IT67_9BACT|nr:MAG: hypothetical protein COV58_04300 [Candidatus Roizmanbacteria bacterium CG11_big_fil_rev_8_21_14_0_20_36_8]PIZ66098.1 MAG: hypothetical protein COY14_00950 [Candidatus Roizmanbacteria bacterium CG_4_10_14_0_2_um_filter_36_9]
MGRLLESLLAMYYGDGPQIGAFARTIFRVGSTRGVSNKVITLAQSYVVEHNVEADMGAVEGMQTLSGFAAALLFLGSPLDVLAKLIGDNPGPVEEVVGRLRNMGPTPASPPWA